MKNNFKYIIHNNGDSSAKDPSGAQKLFPLEWEEYQVCRLPQAAEKLKAFWTDSQRQGEEKRIEEK